MLICPTVFLKVKQEYAMKEQQNGHKCHATIPSQKSENSKNSINFFSHSQLQYRLCDLISD